MVKLKSRDACLYMKSSTVFFLFELERCTYHRLYNQTSNHTVWNHSILPLYSMVLLNQPHHLMFFRFGEISPRFGESKNNKK